MLGDTSVKKLGEIPLKKCRRLKVSDFVVAAYPAAGKTSKIDEHTFVLGSTLTKLCHNQTVHDSVAVGACQLGWPDASKITAYVALQHSSK